MNTSTIGSRVREARKAAKLSQQELASRIGIRQPTLSALESGENLDTKFLPDIEKETGYRALWLKFGKGPKLVGEEQKIGSMLRLKAGDELLIPLLDVAGSMGLGELVPDHIDVVRHIAVSVPDLRQQCTFTAPDRLAFITAYGNSMEPTYSDGDVLLVDQTVSDIKYDAVYVLEKAGELFIKRLQRRPDGSLLMISDNKLYEPQAISKADMLDFSVRGRVVLAWNARKL